MSIARDPRYRPSVRLSWLYLLGALVMAAVAWFGFRDLPIVPVFMTSIATAVYTWRVPQKKYLIAEVLLFSVIWFVVLFLLPIPFLLYLCILGMVVYMTWHIRESVAVVIAFGGILFLASLSSRMFEPDLALSHFFFISAGLVALFVPDKAPARVQIPIATGIAVVSIIASGILARWLDANLIFPLFITASSLAFFNTMHLRFWTWE